MTAFNFSDPEGEEKSSDPRDCREQAVTPREGDAAAGALRERRRGLHSGSLGRVVEPAWAVPRASSSPRLICIPHTATGTEA